MIQCQRQILQNAGNEQSYWLAEGAGLNGNGGQQMMAAEDFESVRVKRSDSNEM